MTRKILMVALSIMLMECTATKITSSWKFPGVEPKPYAKLLILGLINDTDIELRQRMEEHLTYDLINTGHYAMSAFHEFGPKMFEGMTQAEVLAKLEDSGIEGVVTVALLNKKKEKNYVPGNMQPTAYEYYNNRFWDYYGAMNRRISDRGYYEINTTYYWESNFYDMDYQQLVYSVQTESFDPVSTNQLAHEYGQLIVKDLLKSNVISKNKSVGTGRGF